MINLNQIELYDKSGFLIPRRQLLNATMSSTMGPAYGIENCFDGARRPAPACWASALVLGHVLKRMLVRRAPARPGGMLWSRRYLCGSPMAKRLLHAACHWQSFHRSPATV